MSLILLCAIIFLTSLAIGSFVGNFFHVQGVKSAFPQADIKIWYIFKDPFFCLIMFLLALCVLIKVAIY